MKSDFWHDPARQQQLEELAARGLRAKEIGRRMGITKNTVIGRARRTEVRLADQRVITDKQRALVRDLYDRGASYDEIEAAAKVNRGSISSCLRADQVRRRGASHVKQRGEAFAISAIAANLLGESQAAVCARLGFYGAWFSRWRRTPDLWARGEALARRIREQHAAKEEAIAAEKARLACEAIISALELNTPLLNEMKPRDRQMMVARIGGRPCAYIASDFGVSRERVRQIEIKWRLRGLVVPGAADLNMQSIEKAKAREAARRTGRARGRPRKPVKDAAYWAMKVDQAIAAVPIEGKAP